MDRAVHTYKASLVAKGYTQTPEIDYDETFSPVADIRAIRILIAIAAFYDYEIWQMDVKTAFLNRYLNEENSKCATIPMQEKLKLSQSQGASTPAKIWRMQNIPYASAVGSIIGDIKRELRVSCYTDAGYLTNVDDMKSQTGYVFILNGDAEYTAAFDASKEAVWIRKFIFGLGVIPTIEEPINMYCDNIGAIAIPKDHGVTKGARHFRAKVYYLRETIEMGDVRIEKVDTDDNLADPFTKALAFPKHSELTEKIGMIPASSLM
ncbi:retrotransposon protein, putative, ty1-copia subclass [Tanacetum coccineum]